MTVIVLLALIALAGIVGTVRLVSIDGHRRIPERCTSAGATGDSR